MSEQTCQCGRPTAGAWLCPRCIKTLEVALGNIPAYYDDLETLRTKQTRYSHERTKGSIGKAQPLGMDARFARAGAGSEVDHDARNTVSTWCRVVMEEQPQLEGPHCRHACLHVSCGAVFRRRFPKRDTVRSMCAYLLRQLDYLIREQWADEILDEILSVERRLARFIDRPADRWYAGKCSVKGDDDEPCEAELYALAEKGYIDCPQCKTRHNVEERRDFLLTEAREVSVTATEAAGALLAWTDYDGSEEKLIDRIRKWADRDRLMPHGSVMVNGRPRDLFRLGDIEARLIEHARHEQERTMRRPA